MSRDGESQPEGERRAAAYHPEDDQLPRSLILRTMLAAVMITVSLCFATYLLLRGRMLQLRPSYTFPERTLPAPHTVAEVRQELFQPANPRPTMQQAESAALERFEWVDRARGIVRLPIETASDVVARRNAGRPTP
jgi:hypothetical protein